MRNNLFVIPAKARIQSLFKVWIPAFTGMTLLFFAPAQALTVEEPLTNPVQEVQAKQLFHELRCVVCQSESIADSPADVASDMRRDIRRRLKNGESPEAVKAGLVARYGNHILMKPPFNSNTVFLWVGPLLIVIAAIGMAFYYFRHPRASGDLSSRDGDSRLRGNDKI